jgi:BMFP domain-containing protein YqiC
MNLIYYSESDMIDPSVIEKIAKDLGNYLPPPLKAIQGELETNLKQVLQSALGNLDLVSREQFDVQSELLVRTRLKLEALEKRMAEMES